MKKIKKGDDIVVVAGKDKGRRGMVLKVRDDGRLVVEGINIARKHLKPNPTRGISGGIVETEMPLDESNVMLWNPVSEKGDRVGFKVLEDGRKVRFFKSDGEVVDI